MLTEDLKLREAQPKDSPHLLLWNIPNDLALRQIAIIENAECISYRQHLLNRIPPKSTSLALDRRIERELDAITTICNNANKPVVILKDLDCLVSYLHVKPNTPITLFWQSLYNLRHLQSILWIILPTKLKPPIWDKSRYQDIS